MVYLKLKNKKQMSDFYVYFQIGLKHVLDWNGYDHVLYLLALNCTSSFKEWKRVLFLVSFFTIGHTLSLLLSVFGFIIFKTDLIELMIPLTILVTAIFNIFTIKKTNKHNSIGVVATITFLFGVVHGIGFSNYFQNLLMGSLSDKIFPTLSFSIGIEAAQVVVVIAVLTSAYVLQTFFKITKREFVLVVSSIVVGVVLPMILERI